jgi:hypothetical protein
MKIIRMMTKKRKELLRVLDSYHKTYQTIRKVFHALREGEDKGDSRVKQDFVLGIEKFKELRVTTLFFSLTHYLVQTKGKI